MALSSMALNIIDGKQLRTREKNPAPGQTACHQQCKNIGGQTLEVHSILNLHTCLRKMQPLSPY